MVDEKAEKTPGITSATATSEDVLVGPDRRLYDEADFPKGEDRNNPSV